MKPEDDHAKMMIYGDICSTSIRNIMVYYKSTMGKTQFHKPSPSHHYKKLTGGLYNRSQSFPGLSPTHLLTVERIQADSARRRETRRFVVEPTDVGPSKAEPRAGDPNFMGVDVGVSENGVCVYIIIYIYVYIYTYVCMYV